MLTISALLGAVLNATKVWLKERKPPGPHKRFRELALSSLIGEMVTVSAVLAVIFGTCCWFIIDTIYVDHMRLVGVHAADIEANAQLKRDLEFHRHNVSTTDPVFPNLIYMLQAFRQFRNAIGGESCVVSFTATPQSAPLARVMAQLSIQASNCFTFGPEVGDRDPDVKARALNGAIPDAIVFHAARDDNAVNSLFDNLGNQIRLVRSYDLPAPNYQIPPGGYTHTVWLQFGSDVKWNSERR